MKSYADICLKTICTAIEDRDYVEARDALACMVGFLRSGNKLPTNADAHASIEFLLDTLRDRLPE